MAKVTRLQLDTLENKLNRIIKQKQENYANKTRVSLSAQYQAELIQAGKVKPRKDIPDLSKCDRYLQVSTLFDFSKYEEVIDKNLEKYRLFRDRLQKKKQDILDAYVLQGLDDIKDMIKELEEFEVK